MKKIICLVVLLGSLTALPAFAESAMDQVLREAREEAAAMDTNKDGKITEEEFLSYRLKTYAATQKETYAKIDSMKKGSFTVSEYVNYVEQEVQAITNKLNQRLRQVR